LEIYKIISHVNKKHVNERDTFQCKYSEKINDKNSDLYKKNKIISSEAHSAFKMMNKNYNEYLNK
jgi:hypothetical protein